MTTPFIGENPSIVQIREHITTWALSNDPLIIIGEPGVGKTLLADHIHEVSGYREFPIRILDLSTMKDRAQRLALCGSDPPEVTSSKRSVLEHSTTVVLKHLNLAQGYIQEKLAESLRTKTVTRFGASRARPMNARVIIVLSMEPNQLLIGQRIHEHLYELMLNWELVRIPPLRERVEDIPLLVSELFRQGPNRTQNEEEIQRIVETVKQRDYQENVAGIRFLIREMAGEIEGEEHDFRRLLLLVKQGEPISLKQQLGGIEMSLVEQALKRAQGNQSAAARLLGITDRTLRRLQDRQPNHR